MRPKNKQTSSRRGDKRAQKDKKKWRKGRANQKNKQSFLKSIVDHDLAEFRVYPHDRRDDRIYERLLHTRVPISLCGCDDEDIREFVGKMRDYDEAERRSHCSVPRCFECLGQAQRIYIPGSVSMYSATILAGAIPRYNRNIQSIAIGPMRCREIFQTLLQCIHSRNEKPSPIRALTLDFVGTNVTREDMEYLVDAMSQNKGGIGGLRICNANTREDGALQTLFEGIRQHAEYLVVLQFLSTTLSDSELYDLALLVERSSVLEVLGLDQMPNVQPFTRIMGKQSGRDSLVLQRTPKKYPLGAGDVSNCLWSVEEMLLPRAPTAIRSELRIQFDSTTSNGFQSISRALECSQTELKSLCFEGVDMRSDRIQLLARSLVHNTTLERLRLYCDRSCLNYDGVATFLEVLSQSGGSALRLFACPNYVDRADTAILRRIVDVLPRLRKLESLRVCASIYCDEQATLLLEALKKQPQPLYFRSSDVWLSHIVKQDLREQISERLRLNKAVYDLYCEAGDWGGPLTEDKRRKALPFAFEKLASSPSMCYLLLQKSTQDLAGKRFGEGRKHQTQSSIRHCEKSCEKASTHRRVPVPLARLPGQRHTYGYCGAPSHAPN
ncbi:expressed unknown protein [Seminavis robusta]|uniref:Uncharacterized protein n=1 Tax=Seminavis robusta TaxID=568900 RepID=A0A9N8EH59_9STRA|nr:expressed unknown protein [Seminavis robusta]|eukprot:Sro1125_g243960.1 n/a (610) ;mRNA; f:26461-28290